MAHKMRKFLLLLNKNLSVHHRICKRYCSTKCHNNLTVNGVLPVALKQKNGDILDVNISIWEPLCAAELQSAAPVVMAIHGVPGSSDDFKEIGDTLGNKGIRFIVPEFPGFGKSELQNHDVYKLDHSTEGKYEMLKAIVSALGLKKIDVLVGHSAGTWLAYKACADLEIVKSGVFLNPLGARPHRAAWPYWAVKSFSWSLRNRFTHPISYKLLPVVYKIVGFTVTDPSPLQVAVETVATCGFENMNRYADTIKDRELPVLFAWTQKDKIVEYSISMEMAHKMGIHDSEMINIDRENNKTFPLNLDEDGLYKRALSFERGGHLIQKAHSIEITNHVIELIKHLQRQT